MSYIMACPICGNSIMGPTLSPNVETSGTVITTKCHRCDTILKIAVEVLVLGARAATVPPVQTSKR